MYGLCCVRLREGEDERADAKGTVVGFCYTWIYLNTWCLDSLGYATYQFGYRVGAAAGRDIGRDVERCVA